MSSQANYFVDGGTLRPQAPSYVTRPADHALLEHVLDAEFCYVLTARQSGKSSLMVRTARVLQDRNTRTAIVDLTIIGTVPIDQWYLGLLKTIASGVRVRTDVSQWWREHSDLGEPQRFFEFLSNVVLREIADPIAIFIDEIDTTLNLSFRDDFFAAIRAMYNARASNPIFKRLTFILFGVATPTDLIKDQKRTPFNIGTRIELQDFSYEDADPLSKGLEIAHHNEGDRILRRIFYWTNGHPYLTQRLCLLAAQRPLQRWSDAQVDELVQTTFFADTARSDRNIAFIRERMHDPAIPERQRVLELYKAVVSGIPVANDDRSVAQNHLELVGLVRVEKGRVQVRNRIYYHIFDEQWIQSLLSVADTTVKTLPELDDLKIVQVEEEKKDQPLPVREKELPPRPTVRIPLWGVALATLIVIALIVALWVSNRSASAGNTQATSTAAAIAALTRSAEPPTLIPSSAPSNLPQPTNTPVTPPTNTPVTPPTNTPVTPPTNTPVTPPTNTPVTPPTTVSSPTLICTLSSSRNIRSTASMSSNIIGSLPSGDFRPLARDQNGNWLLVQGPGNVTGWLSYGVDFVSCNFNLRDLRVVVSPPAPTNTPTPTPTELQSAPPATDTPTP